MELKEIEDAINRLLLSSAPYTKTNIASTAAVITTIVSAYHDAALVKAADIVRDTSEILAQEILNLKIGTK
jgi:hypothetical protein